MNKIIVGELENTEVCITQTLFVNCECYNLKHLIRILVQKYKDELEAVVTFESQVETYQIVDRNENIFLYLLQILKFRLVNAFNILIGKKAFLAFDFLMYGEVGKELAEKLKKSIELVENTGFKNEKYFI